MPNLPKAAGIISRFSFGAEGEALVGIKHKPTNNTNTTTNNNDNNTTTNKKRPKETLIGPKAHMPNLPISLNPKLVCPISLLTLWISGGFDSSVILI